MSLVVSDTSPLTNLAAIGQFRLLQQLYNRPLLDALRQQAGVYLGDSPYREALRLAHE